jgi:hypothetical protein
LDGVNVAVFVGVGVAVLVAVGVDDGVNVLVLVAVGVFVGGGSPGTWELGHRAIQSSFEFASRILNAIVCAPEPTTSCL